MDSVKGRLLIATPDLIDPNFRRTVIYMSSHDEEGAFGLVLNRPVPMAPVAEYLPLWSEWATAPSVLFNGGPVEPTAAFALGRSSYNYEDTPGWTAIARGVGLVNVGADPQAFPVPLDAFRAFAGYSGWGAGQLDRELSEGAWFVLDAEPGDPFIADPETLFRAVLSRQPGKMAMYAYFPDDPRQN
jgi:putative transcriptional regulator